MFKVKRSAVKSILIKNMKLVKAEEENPLLGRVAQLSNSAFYIPFN